MDNNKNCVEIYKGKSFNNNMKLKRSKKKVIIFDLDETLGSFVDLEILWKALNTTEIDFNELFDIYPEFLRYGILYILEYIYSKKKKSEYYKIFIYTNNQSPPYWIKLLTQYFQYKLSINENDPVLFDQIIYAFKINNVRYELGRTTHKKTYNDLVRCTILHKDTSICFIDDTNYDDMKNDHVYYIQPFTYYHRLSTHDIIHRFIASNVGSTYINKYNINIQMLHDKFISKCRSFKTYNPTYNCTNAELECNIEIAKRMMYHIKEFFLLSTVKNNTRKKRSIKKMHTLKMRT